MHRGQSPIPTILFQVERTDEMEDVDIDQSDDEFEEYEWAGQTRVRASSLMLRDASAAGQHCGYVLYASDFDRDCMLSAVFDQ